MADWFVGLVVGLYGAVWFLAGLALGSTMAIRQLRKKSRKDGTYGQTR